MSPPGACLFLFLLSFTPTLQSSSLYLPVQKDHSTHQYIITAYLKTPLQPTRLVLDLGASFTWLDCFSNYTSTSYSHISCSTPLCNSFHSLACGNCYEPPAPGCANDTCDFFPENPITVQADLRNAIVDSLALPFTTGGPLSVLNNFIFSCAKTALLKGLARNVSGMAALGRSNISLQAQVIKDLNAQNVFAICLSPSKGVTFIGSSGPYSFLPGVDASSFLSYTPLVVNPVGLTIITYYGYPSDEYFVNLTSVKVNGVSIPLNRTLLAIDTESGYGGTKISTVTPYTTVHSSIYKALTSAFVGAALTTNLTLVSKPIKPFRYCYRAGGITSTRVGPRVPTVDLVMGNGAAWRVFGGNSMVYVKKKKVGYYCLGFMDGGASPMTSVVIGGYQLEDNLLQFDLGANRLGFSSSLLSRQTTCANFNFTTASGTSR